MNYAPKLTGVKSARWREIKTCHTFFFLSAAVRNDGVDANENTLYPLQVTMCDQKSSVGIKEQSWLNRPTEVKRGLGRPYPLWG